MASIVSHAWRDRIGRCGVIAVLVVDRVCDAVPVARALLRGGIDVVELTLRTADALEVLARIRDEVPEICLGVGTVLHPDQVKAVKEAGAAFAVSPGVSVRVLQAARECGLPFMPGVATPTDIQTALEHECRDLKFFPSEPCGGLTYLRSLAAPFAHCGTQFIPLGGVMSEQIATYLADPLVLGIGGSMIAPRELIQAEAWDRVTRRAAEASRVVASVRSNRGVRIP